MQVNNYEWQDTYPIVDNILVLQNTGDVRIAFVIANSHPAADDIPLDSGDHGILYPLSAPITITDLTTNSMTCYVRALGPRDGKLYTF